MRIKPEDLNKLMGHFFLYRNYRNEHVDVVYKVDGVNEYIYVKGLSYFEGAEIMMINKSDISPEIPKQIVYRIGKTTTSVSMQLVLNSLERETGIEFTSSAVEKVLRLLACDYNEVRSGKTYNAYITRHTHRV